MDIDNVQENARRVTQNYAIGNIIYSKITGIYCKLDYSKHEPYKTTKVFTNGTVQVKRGQVNEHINIRRLMPQFLNRPTVAPRDPN